MERRIVIRTTNDGEKYMALEGDIEFRQLERYVIGSYVPREKVFSSNLSTEFTTLIQNAGRWCERFASDILHDVKSIERFLESAYDDYCNVTEGEITEKNFLFGFREDGVDHWDFIQSRVINDNIKTYYYRALYELSFRVHRDERHLQVDCGFTEVSRYIHEE